MATGISALLKMKRKKIIIKRRKGKAQILKCTQHENKDAYFFLLHHGDKPNGQQTCTKLQPRQVVIERAIK